MARFALVVAVLLALAAFGVVVLALNAALWRARRELTEAKALTDIAEGGLRDVLGDNPEFAHNHARATQEQLAQERRDRRRLGRHSASPY